MISTLLLAGWIALWANWLAAVALVGGVFVHEFGHLLVINWAGAGPSRIRIIPFFGGAATMRRAPDSEFKGVLIALAGPALGLVAALPFWGLAALTGQRAWLAGAFYVGALNLINLAPAAPLDGAKAFGPALARIHPQLERAALVVIAIAALAWAIERRSYLFAAVIAFGALRAFMADGLRPAARPLSAVEWAASVALYAAVVAACAAVTVAAAGAAGITLVIPSFGVVR
jgi:Zn-dependent protease